MSDRGPYLLRKIRGFRECLAENGAYYTWHHFVGKIGRRIARVPVLEGLSRFLLAYAHELHWFVPREGCSAAQGFPPGTEPVSYTRMDLPSHPRRVALFAVFTAGGRIPETTRIYLKGLREVADVIVCIGDCPLFPDELPQLKELADVLRFERHGTYDFGSYRRAYLLAEELGLLAKSPEVILANDSCYGPVFPLSEAFAAMSARGFDFWGMTANLHMGQKHLQSYFYCFGRRVISTGAVRGFLLASERLVERKEIIEFGEKRLTHVLERQGYTWGSYIDYLKLRNNPTTFPVRLLKNRCPLIKAKAIDGESHESIRQALKVIGAVNPRLHDAIMAKIASERDPNKMRRLQ